MPSMKMYAMRYDGTPGALLAEGDSLSALTSAHHGRAHGRIGLIERVGGGRHHIMQWDDGRPDTEQDHPREILVLLPGDTNYPEEDPCRP